MAEREGFEPSVPLLAVHTISSRAPSAGSDISPQLISLLKIRYKTSFFDELYLSNSKPRKKYPLHFLFVKTANIHNVSPGSICWRRGWDSNPRSRYSQDTAFRERGLQPLGHLSGSLPLGYKRFYLYEL
jgi:hypothetical protein